ncbi:MAG: undecaprenyl-diphosphatase UppP [Candidatus Magasanikbacteria bacterium]|nr:undecaprenyl-diphosphatase UppP [Candidatus Magasanikbacteria bacterium]
MGILQAGVLGIIQGLTEFLPVSSSGHLIFLPKLFGWADQGLAFDAIIHLGTLIAVVWYFRRRLWDIVAERRGEQRKLGLLILLTVIPAGVAGLLFGDWIETHLRGVGVVAFGMIFWGIVLYVAEVKSKKHEVKSLDVASWKAALFVGCAQAIALVPGTSRSGITMTAGLFSKLDKKSAAEFSFLISVPIIALAGLKSLFDLWRDGFSDLNWLALSVGLVAAALSGLLAIWGLLKMLQKWSFKPFVVYRIVIGILIILLF